MALLPRKLLSECCSRTAEGESVVLLLTRLGNAEDMVEKRMRLGADKGVSSPCGPTHDRHQYCLLNIGRLFAARIRRTTDSTTRSDLGFESLMARRPRRSLEPRANADLVGTIGSISPWLGLLSPEEKRGTAID